MNDILRAIAASESLTFIAIVAAVATVNLVAANVCSLVKVVVWGYPENTVEDSPVELIEVKDEEDICSNCGASLLHDEVEFCSRPDCQEAAPGGD